MMRITKWLAVSAVAAIFLVACSGSGNQSPTAPTSAVEQPTSTEPSKTAASTVPQKLSFKVIGTCTSEEGTLTAVGKGFTPGGNYTTEATYPDGKPYTGLANPGTASGDGTTPNWNWPCSEGAGGKGTHRGSTR